MGKQKKGAAAKSNNKKKEKKEQKKERRAQANAQAKIDSSRDEVERIFQELHLENSLLVGRLYYYLPDYPYDPNDVNSYRGILKQLVGDENDGDNGKAVFQPVFPLGDSDDHRVTVPLRNVIRQRVAWTLRYGVGDLVVVYDDYTDAFVEAKIEHVWPVWESPGKAFGKNRTGMIVLYLCRTMDREQRAIKVSKDEDYHIQRLPTSFRFSPGDRVVVSTTRALFPGDDSRVGNEMWQTGTVKDTHVLNQDVYAYYECELNNATGDRRRGPSCFILGDSVAFIFSASASPRETLFAAIGDPAFKRKDFSSFVERYGIDVSIFFDHFVAKRQRQLRSLELAESREETEA
jgi:hypothetical protein